MQFKPTLAFTLVELLVVITVIVIILALLAPAMDSAMQRAEEVRCAAIQRQMGVANAMYSMEFKGWYALIKEAGTANALIPGTAGQPPTLVGFFAWPMNGAYKKLAGFTPPAANPYDMAWPKSYGCPHAPPALTAAGVTWKTMGFNWGGTGAAWADQIGIKRSRVGYPSDAVQLTDLNDWHTDAIRGGADYVTGWDANSNPEATNAQRPGMVAYRHREGANIQHFDASVRYYGKQEAWKSGGVAANERMWKVYP